MRLRQIITEYADQHDLVAGVCSADPILSKETLTAIPFSAATERERRDPAMLLPGAKSIIVIGQGYAKTMERGDADVGGARRGVFSAMAVGEDYHISVARHLAALRDLLLTEAAFESVAHVDNGPLCERAFAMRAGLGFQGRNQYVISPWFGAFFNLGLLVTTLAIPGDVANAEKTDTLAQECADCGRCEAACPGGALKDGRFDYTRCAAYISQKKGALSPWEEEILGQALYGCDICAQVCPHNHGKPAEVVALEAMMPRVADIESLTNKSFQAQYGQTAIGWRGAAVLKRNAANAVRWYKTKQKGGE